MASTKDQQAKLSIELRRILGDAYSFVRGSQFTQTVANITFEELIDQAIQRIEGTDNRSLVRCTKLDRVKKIKEEVISAVTTAKSKPPEQWIIESDSRVKTEDRANTPEN